MTVFPLSAMVGQSRMRLALLLNAIDPLIGGVLICGRRGTGKSTMARAFSRLLPTMAGVVGCAYFCDPAAPQAMCHDCAGRYAHGENLPVAYRPTPFVTLPLNASEDRVSGSIDVSATLQSGSYHFAPGVLASANRGFLYVDEINLLNDHIADILLDAAALGVHHVECDGISVVHPARFVLVGTMNPEEGQLRSQLLDRIGLYVETEDLREQEERITLVERRLAFDGDPVGFAALWADSEKGLSARIEAARRALPMVRISRYFRQVIAFLVGRELHAQGHRGDLVVARTARALAAWDTRSEVEQADIEQAILLAMPHRSRPGISLMQQLARTQEQLPPGGTDSDQPEDLGTIDDDLEERTSEREGPAGLSRPLRGALDAEQVKGLITVPRDRRTRHESGRRFVSLTARRSGRLIRDRQAHPVTDIAFSATIRAAAPFQQGRGWVKGEKLQLRPGDLRQKVRERKTRALLIFVVDGSDSVMARQLMAQTKRLLLALLQNAYEKRDRVAMLVFRFAQGRVVLPPTRNYSRARRSVEELYIGGCTPLATGLLEGLRLAETERLRDPTCAPVLVVLTDGLANIDLSGNMRSITPMRDALSVAREIAARRIPTLMVDTGRMPVSNPFISEGQPAQLPATAEELSPGKELALALAADYYQLCPPDMRGNGTSTLLKRG